MNSGSIAVRYSRALFEEARAQNLDTEIYERLGVLLHSMRTVKDLQGVLVNPRVHKEKKFILLTTSSGMKVSAEDNLPQAGNPRQTLYQRFLWLVLEHEREDLLRTIIYVYRDLYREHYEIDRVVFETATSVDEALLKQVEAKVHARTGRAVELVSKVRPELIGGFCLRIGDVRYDYSYKTRLQNIRKRLWNR